MTPVRDLQEPLARAKVEEAVSDVLARREFMRERNLFEEFASWLAKRLDLGTTTLIGEILFWFLIGTLAGLLGYFLARFVMAGRALRRAERETHPARPTVPERVSLLRLEAAAARARGELSLALRKEIFALILGLVRRGDLEFRDSWTNKELLRRGHPSPEIRTLLEPLVRELEPKEFGRERTTQADVRRLEELCVRYLGPLSGEPG